MWTCIKTAISKTKHEHCVHFVQLHNTNLTLANKLTALINIRQTVTSLNNSQFSQLGWFDIEFDILENKYDYWMCFNTTFFGK